MASEKGSIRRASWTDQGNTGESVWGGGAPPESLRAARRRQGIRQEGGKIAACMVSPEKGGRRTDDDAGAVVHEDSGPDPRPGVDVNRRPAGRCPPPEGWGSMPGGRSPSSETEWGWNGMDTPPPPPVASNLGPVGGGIVVCLQFDPLRTKHSGVSRQLFSQLYCLIIFDKIDSLRKMRKSKTK